MSSLEVFKKTLSQVSPASDWSSVLKSLWYDGKGDWQAAHAEVDHLNSPEAAWVHAYLHRKEGDLWNADYWYSRAKKTRPRVSLEEEWEQLVQVFFVTFSSVS